MTIRVLSNLHALCSLPKQSDALEFAHYPTRGKQYWAIGRMLFMQPGYDYILLNCLLPETLFLLLLKTLWPFWRCRVIALDLILPPPFSKRERLLYRIKGFLLSKLHFCIIYFKNIEGYIRWYKIPAEKLIYVPFKVNSLELIRQTKVSDKGYIFSGGRTRRDFATLFAAVEGLPVQVKVIAQQNHKLAPHGTRLDPDRAPDNVDIIHDDDTVESFISFMAGARMIVLPIVRENISASGIGVYLQAMALRKPVIISAGPAVDRVLPPRTAIIVPPGDSKALKTAIVDLYTNSALREEIAANGYKYAMSLGGEERLVNDLVTLILRDAGGHIAAVPQPCAIPRDETWKSPAS